MSVEDINDHALLVHGIGQFQVCLEDVPHKAALLVVDVDLPAIFGQDFLLEFVDPINYKTKLLHTDRATIQCWKLMIRQLQKSREQFPYPANHGVLVPVSLADGSDLTEIFFNNSLHLKMKSKFLTD